METATTPAILLLDLPQGALGGIDLLSFTTSPRFRGIKHLPPGVHFAFAGATSALSLRHGLWFEIPEEVSSSGPPLVITKWDPTIEGLVAETSGPEILRQRANIGSLWRESLTPYRQSAGNKESKSGQNSSPTIEDGSWKTLSNTINTDVLKRILGVSASDWVLNSSSSAIADQDDIAHLTQQPSATTPAISSSPSENNLNLLPISFKQTWPPHATGRQRTTCARDRSWYLCDLINTHTSTKSAATEIPAELQFCFTMVLTLNNYSCLAQWRRLITLVLTSPALVPLQDAGELFLSTLKTLQDQLEYVSRSDSSDGDNDNSNNNININAGSNSDVAALFELDDERTGKAWLQGLIQGFAAGLNDVVSDLDNGIVCSPSFGDPLDGTPAAGAQVGSGRGTNPGNGLLELQRSRVGNVADALEELVCTLRDALDWTLVDGLVINRPGCDRRGTGNASSDDHKDGDDGTRQQQQQQQHATTAMKTTTTTTSSSYLRIGKLQLEDGETVDMDFGSSDQYDAEHEEGEYAPVFVDL